FQAEDGIRDATVTGVQTCALPICKTLFDLHEYALAWAYYTFSIKAAQGASNHDLWAAGLGRMSLLLIYWEQPREALPLLQEAQQLGRASCRDRVWMWAVAAVRKEK